MATTGSDAGDGSAAHPFATLDHARVAMETGSIHTTTIEAGTYKPGATLTLGAADSGETFTAAPGQAAVLDGAGTLVSLNGATGVTISGLTFSDAGSALVLSGSSGDSIVGNHFLHNGTGIVLDGASHNTVSGNEVDSSANNGIEAKNASTYNTFDSNIVNGVASLSSSGGGFYLHGASDNTISHNLVENTAGVGIAVENWDGTTINLADAITGNIVKNTGDATPYDSGGIYVLGRSGLDTGITISNNLIDGTGPGGGAHDVAIYLDDDASGITVTNNIVRNPGTHGVQVHGGHDVSIDNNIFDLGSATNSTVFFQNTSDAMVSNASFTHNIVTTTEPGQTLFDNYSNSGGIAVHDNLYYSSLVASLPPVLDTRPFFGNPLFANPAAGDYTLSAGSSASLIGFKPIDQTAYGLHPATAHWY